MDSIAKRPVVKASYIKSFVSREVYITPKRQVQAPRINFNYAGLLKQKVPLMATVVVVLVAFTGGMWAAVHTPKTDAETSVTQPGMLSLGPAPAGTTAGNVLSNDVLFNTPIELLQSYFTPTPVQDQLADRKAKLKAFLQDRGSPLADEADVIAEQPHWKLILAISFAESTLGKHCGGSHLNCSGIGGSQLRAYKSLDNWILDFNRLLDQRYKDDTLEQMCGVYVQPCNPNWLLATQQILTALEEQNIE